MLITQIDYVAEYLLVKHVLIIVCRINQQQSRKRKWMNRWNGSNEIVSSNSSHSISENLASGKL